MESAVKLAIFASGSGSTAEVLFDKAAVIITNNRSAGIWERVANYKDRKIDILWMPSKPKFRGLPEDIDPKLSIKKYGEELVKALEGYDVDFISLNGFSVKIPENFIKRFEGRIANSHPAPLRHDQPDFGGQGMHGLTVHAAVLNFARSIDRPFKTEVCEHLVTPAYDQGQVLTFTEVKVKADDTPESLQERVKKAEIRQLKEFWDNIKPDQILKPIPPRPAVVWPDEIGKWQQAMAQALEEYPQG